jgi:hypothetical protein
MSRFRSALARVAIVWLACQSTSLAAVPVAMWSEATAALECTCGHGAHAMCPLHHRSASGSHRCAMRALADVDSVMIVSLLGPTGLMPASPTFTSPRRRIDVATLDVDDVVLREVPPDPPPPRA